MLHPIDIITKSNRPTNQRSDPEDATNRGLWHRGVHVALYTSNGKILIQKRSLEMISKPGLLEIGVGGFVDSGETPEQAAIREVKEETNIHITEDQLRFIGLTRYNHHWKYGRRQKISRTIIYSYICRLNAAQTSNILPQQGEVERINFIPLRSTQQLIHQHQLKRFGVLSPTYAFYQRIVRAVSADMRLPSRTPSR